jgi:hypothetical protein
VVFELQLRYLFKDFLIENCNLLARMTMSGLFRQDSLGWPDFFVENPGQLQ